MVQGVKVYFAENIYLWSQFLLAFQGKDLTIFFSRVGIDTLFTCACSYNVFLFVFFHGLAFLYGVYGVSFFIVLLLYRLDRFLAMRLFCFLSLVLFLFLHCLVGCCSGGWLSFYLSHRLLWLGGFLLGGCYCVFVNRVFCFLFSNRLGCWLFADIVKVDFANRLEFLHTALWRSLFNLLFFLFSRALFLLGVFKQQFFGLISCFLVGLEGLNECMILFFTQFEIQVVSYFTQFTSLFQEFNSCLKSYIQFTYCFV